MEVQSLYAKYCREKWSSPDCPSRPISGGPEHYQASPCKTPKILVWTSDMLKAFQDAKAVLVRATMLTQPYRNAPTCFRPYSKCTEYRQLSLVMRQPKTTPFELFSYCVSTLTTYSTDIIWAIIEHQCFC